MTAARGAGPLEKERPGAPLDARPIQKSAEAPPTTNQAKPTTALRLCDELAAMDASEARAVTDRIKVGVEEICGLIKQAYMQRAWSALGYASWPEYCTREFGASRLRLPREKRTEVVASLRQSGLSIRAIAVATGHDTKTVQSDLRSGVGNSHTSQPVDEDALAEALIAAEAPVALVFGMDNKRYQLKPSARQPKPSRKPPTYLPELSPYLDEWTRAAYDLQRLVERFARLLADDRYAEHRADLNLAWFPDLVLLFKDVLTDFEPVV